MILKQFYLNCLAHASYVIGDEQTRTAAVVDPQRDVDGYLAFAAEHGLRVAHVFLTHLHADFLAGHLELRDRVGATIYLGKAARAEYAFQPLGDGDAVQFGQVRVDAIETPGHSPESICLAVYDLTESGTAPKAVLTGDTLFVGDVGRPDLHGVLGWTAAELGALLYSSLHDKLLKLPDSCLVYPAHGAGSLCGKALSQETMSTVGDERRSNYALRPMSKEQFIALVTIDQPDAPSYFVYDAVLNSRERQTLEQALARELNPLTIDELLAAQQQGAQLLDTRDPAEFAAAHLDGSINIGLIGQYATWAGTVLARERPIAIVADPGAETESALRLGRIGFDHVIGYLAGGLRSADGSEARIVSTERLSAEVAARRLAEGGAPVLVDVRAPGERAQKHIGGSLHIPLTRLTERMADIPADRPVLVFCAGGYRSSIAASLLQRAGRAKVSELAGGITAWEAAGLPLLSG
ncbi:MAG: sulfurtransferase [Acidobacteria bacterium RIFCSPLOWO2_02_FULL_68_18]|nr:MAG: sulfurtransferase [Acidobacteria bacterium RIFCSPLOWO2_02_FULL_68_18]OFW51507.1 MAG: sulfurtransferase [Acidobacteria bacterium RIFCSPLOWO2_12_FULL_68_19]